MSNQHDPANGARDRVDMNAHWLRLTGIKPNEHDKRDRLAAKLLAFQDVFDLLVRYLDEKEASMEAREKSEEDFADAAWSHKQAFRNGKRAAYEELRSFIPRPKESE